MGIRIATCHNAMLYFVEKAKERLMRKMSCFSGTGRSGFSTASVMAA